MNTFRADALCCAYVWYSRVFVVPSFSGVPEDEGNGCRQLNSQMTALESCKRQCNL